MTIIKSGQEPYCEQKHASISRTAADDLKMRYWG